MASGWHDTGRGWGPYGLAARVAGAEARAQIELDAAIADLAIAEATRLDDRTRLGVDAMLGGLVATIGATLRRHAARLLADRDIDGDAVLRPVAAVMPRLVAGGILRDRALVGDLVARVRHDQIAAALPETATDLDTPGLLIRLAGATDRLVAEAALALLGIDGRRREAWDRGDQGIPVLPAPLHARIAWQVAAALRAQDASAAVNRAVDRVLAEVTGRLLAGHDEAGCPDAAALRLAAAIDPHSDEIGALLVGAIDDRRLDLFVGLIAHRLGIPMPDMRAIVVDPAGERLWLALRALALDRTALARIALALADADPRRDIDGFALQLDTIASVPIGDAAAALAPLALPPAFHAAIRTLEGRPRP